MTNAEVFNQYGTERWVIEENLCFMLQEFCEEENITPRNNLISFIKKFMKEETIVNVEYATPRTEQMGRVAAIVDTHSSIERLFAIIVDIIFDVNVDKILALTPLPSPSAKTITVEFSFCSTISTWSPQSCSP